MSLHIQIGCRPTIQRLQNFVSCHNRYLSGASKPWSPDTQHLGRRQRRILERATKKQQNNSIENILPITSSMKHSEPSLFYNRILQRARDLGADLSPHSPFGKKLRAAGYRVPLAFVLWLLVLSEDIAPYKIAPVEGASMLPTFAAQGDLVINETGAWKRMLGQQPHYKIGDIIVWRDPNRLQAMSVKRVVGFEGDEVLRFGEYVHKYRDDPSWGITDDPSMQDYDPVGEIDMTRTVVVPKGRVWVEGDNPPFSKDSRHYGPIPREWIRGRVVARIWPLGLPKVTTKRPEPVPMEELVADPHFNVHNLDSKGHNTKKSTM